MRHHILFRHIRTIDDLRYFMQYHVFAVWDFMSLAKRLQMDFTCVSLPWTPKSNHKACRAMNEIILGEETDVDVDGSHISHFEMYLNAMNDIKSNTTPVLSMVKGFENTPKAPFKDIVNKQNIPSYVKDFVNHSLGTAINGEQAEVLGSFFYGREDAIPEMFSSLLKEWGLEENEYPKFVYYLKRHIELDGDSHGPAVNSIISNIKSDTETYTKLLQSALDAVNHRIRLWDGIYKDLTSH
ncbi:DUF3050 domain-containing protein [Commensalibacter oyaizuii]|uniref:DUF3050 domain-containing protein n=1 Tax=Commensalibacter oyaizuii TaxID=3043873 RepID=A0ABT6PZY3_9PROT|nr:DUF3050 domain-containing protein [Commensalibacter sp. TBRC 16381]MDI2090280.1 DUF3050 domain-containing protein [Commensalibacter sp. TBRC 16381]